LSRVVSSGAVLMYLTPCRRTAVVSNRVTCITKPHPHSPREHITNVGGLNSSGRYWYYTREQVADMIDSGDYNFHVRVGLTHDTSRFDCGKIPLNDWIKHAAARSEGKSARCYVLCSKSTVVGFYCIAAGAVQHEGAPRKLRQNMPNSSPVVILGRLAVDKAYQGQGLGRALLKDALLRITKASELVGARAVLVHAVDQESVPFYARYGFRSFPFGNQTLYLPIEEIINSL